MLSLPFGCNTGPRIYDESLETKNTTHDAISNDCPARLNDEPEPNDSTFSFGNFSPSAFFQTGRKSTKEKAIEKKSKSENNRVIQIALHTPRPAKNTQKKPRIPGKV